jgi:hypothetical protein
METFERRLKEMGLRYLKDPCKYIFAVREIQLPSLG